MSKNIKLRDLLNENSLCLGIAYPKSVGVSGGRAKITEKEEVKKKILYGGEDPTATTEPPITKEQKKEFMQAVALYNEYGKSVYRKMNLKDVTVAILKIGELTEKIALEDTDEWFDAQSVQRDMKSLNDAVKLFEKTSKEISVLQHRLETTYEDIGTKLGRYFDIKDLHEGYKKLRKLMKEQTDSEVKELVTKSRSAVRTIEKKSNRQLPLHTLVAVIFKSGEFGVVHVMKKDVVDLPYIDFGNTPLSKKDINAKIDEFEHKNEEVVY